jgi:hypothetical protein
MNEDELRLKLSLLKNSMQSIIHQARVETGEDRNWKPEHFTQEKRESDMKRSALNFKRVKEEIQKDLKAYRESKESE